MAGECLHRHLKTFKKCETCIEDYSKEHWSNLDCEDLHMVKTISFVVYKKDNKSNPLSSF